MTNEQLAQVKEAMYQYELIRIKRLESMPLVEFTPSEAYEKKKAELRVQIRNKSPKIRTLSQKFKLGVLIAVIMLIVSIITACTFGKRIKGFFIDLFESFATADYAEENAETYKEHKLTWLPDNYNEKSNTKFKDNTKIIYSNEYNQILFACFPISNFQSVIDTQRAEFDVLNLEGIEIYYKIKSDAYSIFWINDFASFSIHCTTDIEWADIEKMILSVECVE